MIFVAMVIVASTTFFAPAAPVTTGSAAGKDPRIGVVLVIMGCMAQGVQCKSSRIVTYSHYIILILKNKM